MSADRAAILNALKSLQPLHRNLIRRAHYLGSTTEQMAAELGIDEATVKRELHRALWIMHGLLPNRHCA
ncbi:sigma factor-like helix-turn-helix DNA-binding protein [Mycolicibacterium fluoranthenivorans]|uniref:RNA polymerase sigma factor, sigma-70 family n=1 Tax=Mycolicibacterium fluoranthenivorans TaxID=258505 RepID=A0A1G4V9D8_9MYCO|nr:sigma factor-like helix-turn-helix DNA-binding protein [Mycolicibacterium fluoranthenivorans]SCX03273.1 RNA polymerase sigma factor, sigma-70 family [Mycolicibacterium fluoranthenivorans]